MFILDGYPRLLFFVNSDCFLFLVVFCSSILIKAKAETSIVCICHVPSGLQRFHFFDIFSPPLSSQICIFLCNLYSPIMDRSYHRQKQERLSPDRVLSD